MSGAATAAARRDDRRSVTAEEFAAALAVSRETMAAARPPMPRCSNTGSARSTWSPPTRLTDLWRRHMLDSAQLLPLHPGAAGGRARSRQRRRLPRPGAGDHGRAGRSIWSRPTRAKAPSCARPPGSPGWRSAATSSSTPAARGSAAVRRRPRDRPRGGAARRRCWRSPSRFLHAGDDCPVPQGRRGRRGIDRGGQNMEDAGRALPQPIRPFGDHPAI